MDPQLKEPLNLWIAWCGYGVRQSREELKMVMGGERAEKDARCAPCRVY